MTLRQTRANESLAHLVDGHRVRVKREEKEKNQRARVLIKNACALSRVSIYALHIYERVNTLEIFNETRPTTD